MSALLESKVVLITGGARRVGAAIARRLHDAGANLVVHYRSSAAEARALKADLTAKRRDSVVLVQGDLLKPAHLTGLIKDALKAFGRLDALVNNASSFYPTEMGEITEKEWDVMAGEFQQSLDKFKVPAGEQKELFAIVGTTMPDIVTRQ